MYYKKLQNGKVRFFDTYKSLNGARKQVTVTLETASAQSQRTATKLLAQKINRKIQSELKATEAFNNATLSQVFEVYWNIREQEISPSYAYREKKQFENFLIDFEVGNKKIKSVSSIELQKFVNFFDKPTTRQEFKRILVQLFDFAFDMRYIDVNEAKRIRIPKIKQTIEQKEKRDLKFFTVREFNEFVDAARYYIKNLRDHDRGRRLPGGVSTLPRDAPGAEYAGQEDEAALHRMHRTRLSVRIRLGGIPEDRDRVRHPAARRVAGVLPARPAPLYAVYEGGAGGARYQHYV